MKIIVTGGAGFIGCNAVSRYLKRGHEVVLLDNLYRKGAAENLKWISGEGPIKFIRVDVRDGAAVAKVFRDHSDAALVLHFAGQVAVTTSVADPRLDFEINALGTLNVLEAMRVHALGATLIYSSTNKVYGDMSDVGLVETRQRYEYAAMPHGVGEERGLDFHSPYGCSKGAADQYVRDYHRIFGLNTIVFRQSCIYGTRQFGMADQGWIAWFAIAAELGLPLTLYGDGKQVRDVLFVEDLLEAFDDAANNIDVARGRVYNIGGGPLNAISLLDLIDHIGRIRGARLNYQVETWRPGDQRVYISDIRRAKNELGWQPHIDWRAGVQSVYSWVQAHRAECETAFKHLAPTTSLATGS
jgi:CDP-paratose 2-epimerase